jgi:hypothetical protein
MMRPDISHSWHYSVVTMHPVIRRGNVELYLSLPNPSQKWFNVADKSGPVRPATQPFVRRLLGPSACHLHHFHSPRQCVFPTSTGVLLLLYLLNLKQHSEHKSAWRSLWLNGESLTQAIQAECHLRMSVCFLVMRTVECRGWGKISPPGKAIFSSLTSGLSVLLRELYGVNLFLK